MFAGQWVARFGVIEILLVDGGSLPSRGRMASRTPTPQAALVLVFVACAAAWRKPHPRAVQILARKYKSRLGRNVLFAVACAAAYAHMLSVQRVPGLYMVEARWRRVPVHHLKVDAVVVGMTFRARRAGRTRTRIRGVQSAVLIEFCCDLFVTFKAPERRRSGRDRMTLRAVCISAQALMPSRQRPGRNLCIEGRDKGEKVAEGKRASKDTLHEWTSFLLVTGRKLSEAMLPALAHSSDPWNRSIRRSSSFENRGLTAIELIQLDQLQIGQGRWEEAGPERVMSMRSARLLCGVCHFEVALRYIQLDHLGTSVSEGIDCL